MFNKTFMNKPAAVKNQGSSFASSSLQFSCGLDGATWFYGAVTSLMFCTWEHWLIVNVMGLWSSPQSHTAAAHSSSPQQQPLRVWPWKVGDLLPWFSCAWDQERFDSRVWDLEGQEGTWEPWIHELNNWPLINPCLITCFVKLLSNNV